jgi:L-threonylcarbamoyladenylate synthase
VKTVVARADREDAVSQAVAVLEKGEPVALPTETVYGLAADALNPIAVAKIFETKERPHFDPLIVHLPDRDWLEKISELPAPDRPLILKLMESFWPGPLTIVLPKRAIVPEIVTAGLETVAVRFSAHPVFIRVLREFGKPLAAPSANRFGRISPTTAQHVLEELGGRIPLIIDAGPTSLGLESTIVAPRRGQIDILRRGPVTEEELSAFGRVNVFSGAEKISAPGQLPTHYAPKTQLRLIEDADSFEPKGKERVGLLSWNAHPSGAKFAAVRELSAKKELREAAASLFAHLRFLDSLDLDLIVAERLPEKGLGAAIMDRLRRAANRSQDRPS